MSQKVNPIAVRLKLNRKSDSSWFSDYYYATLLYQDCNFKNYLSSIRQPTGTKLGFRPGRCIMHHYPKRSVIHIFCLGTKRKMKHPSVYSYDNLIPFVFQNTSQSKHAPNESVSHSLDTLRTNGSTKRFAFTPLRFHVQRQSGYDSYYANLVDQLCKSSLNTSEVSIVKKGNSILGFPASLGVLAHFPAQSVHSTLRTSLTAFAKGLNKTPSFKVNHVGRSNLFDNDYRKYLLQISGWISTALKQVQVHDNDTRKVRMLVSLSKLPADLFTLGLPTNSLMLAQPDGEVVLNGLLNPTQLEAVTSSQVTDMGSTYMNYFVMQYCFQMNSCLVHSTLQYIQPEEIQAKYLQLCLAKSRHYYLSNIQRVLSSQTKTLTSIIPMKVTSVYQSALLLAQEICCKLEQTKSFRQICKTIFKEIEMCSYIKGIRIACSGRFNGAEIAKTECKQYGETSLHVFSDQIDYAYTKASTPYGILGVKVWICYL
uniref:Small ribosomal subunit protein uS3m n=1 Tax=Zygnema circumcarinatum TaxID=35869 RepID=A0A6N0GXP6_ZYGCR|nr:ribosomal protein S3 [Zygnema circumcarinatum]